MKDVRGWAGLALIIAASALVNAYYVGSPARSWDETINVKASLCDVSDYSSESGYIYSIDHPALKRYVYGAVLGACGIESITTPDVDYSKGQDWNVEHGHIPPFAVIIPMRATNAAFMTGAVVLVYLAALAALGNGWLAALAAAPLVFSERIATGAVAYLGCDAFLGFFIALALYLMVTLALRGKSTTLWGVILFGVVGGLAASAKLNGALVVVAVMLYLAVASRGPDRLLKPFIAGAVSVIIFVALNPVMRGGGLDWMFGVVWDMMARRRYIWNAQYEEFDLSRAQLVARFFPYMAFVYAMAAGGVILRHRKWFAPLAVWSATIVIGTLFSVNRTYDRYFLPIQMGTFAFAGIVTWALVSIVPRRRAAWKAPARAATLVAAAALSVAVLMTTLAARAPFGPSRVRFGFSPAAKVKLFYRQATAFYGLERRAEREEMAVMLDIGDRQAPSGEIKPGRQLSTPLVRRVIASAFLVAGIALLWVLGARMLKSRLLALLLLIPFLWSEFSQGDFWLHSSSDCFVVFFSVLSLFFWVRAAKDGESRLGPLILAAAFAGAAFAAAPRAVMLVAAVGAWALLSGQGMRPLRSFAVVLLVGAAAFLAAEEAIWRLGADDSLRFAQAMYSGVLRHWPARFADTTNLLIVFRECFPYWPLLPLAGAALWALRRERWAGVLALYGSFTVASAFLGRPASANRIHVDVQLALCIAAGAPGLALLARQVSLKLTLREPGEAPWPPPEPMQHPPG